jgi:ABC-type amino acid transport substrate-binding protein
VIVIPRDAPRLLAAVNEALEALNADGTLAEIKARWLGITSNE